MHSTRATRFLTLLLAAIQFAMPAAVSVAEGALSRMVVDPVAHVESAGGDECTPPHSADCVVCRYLSGSGAPTPEPTPAFMVGAADPARALLPQLHGAAPVGPARSRAPPAV
jgi:hypothetical protein